MTSPESGAPDPAVYLDAISYALREHHGQLRKDGRTPYAAHPVRVAAIMAHEFGVSDPLVLAAAVLHDTLEDTTVDRDDLAQRFGEEVASWVALLTKDSRLPEEERENEYLAALAQAPVPVQLCKIADTLDNLLDCGAPSADHRRKTRAKAQRLLDTLTPAAGPPLEAPLAQLRARILALDP